MGRLAQMALHDDGVGEDLGTIVEGYEVETLLENASLRASVLPLAVQL